MHSPAISRCIRHMNTSLATTLVVALTASTISSSIAFAAATANFAQTITAGTLSVDIVDNNYTSITNPSVSLTAKTFSFQCQKDADASAGTFGTSTQQIYVKNPDAADNGWSVSLAATSPTALWHSASGKGDYDFNDATGSGCDDGSSDADIYAGKLTVDASVGTLNVGSCSHCTTTDISKGASASFAEGTADSVTILTGAAGSDDIGDWKLTGVTLAQSIPSEQAAAADYSIDMTLSVIGS